MARRWTILFLANYSVWCLLNWVPGVQALIVGLPVALLVTLLTASLPTDHISRLFLQPRRLFLFCFTYLPVFWWEHLKANIDVAYRVLHPRLPIRPAIVRVKTELRSDMALTILSNSVSLVPGTTMVDIYRETGTLYVHCMIVDANDREGVARRIVGRFERLLKPIFE